MCDYSIAVKSRSAKVGERLITSNFNSFSRGFASASDPTTAVCLRPGTEIQLHGPLQLHSQSPYEAVVDDTPRTIGTPPSEDARVATFLQVDQQKQNTHHDAIQFKDGSVIKLQHLVEGQEATVLQLPAVPKTREEARRQQRMPATT